MAIKITCWFPETPKNKFKIWNEGAIVKQSGRADLPEVLHEGKTEDEADKYMDGFIDALRIANGIRPVISEPRLRFRMVPNDINDYHQG